MIGRRVFLSACAALAAAGAAREALALGRTPYGGVLRMKLPWPIGALDPHALDDPLAALVGPAVADPLYALDESGRPYPTLATALPEASGGVTRFSLRPGLITARGKPLAARDVVFSLARSAARGGAGLLSPFASAEVEPRDPLAVRVPGADPAALARALASPVTAVVPRGFSPLEPDGTGSFVAQPQRGALVLRRNVRAARGAAFLDAIEITQAADLADGLRAFEASNVDVGWLGAGLYRPRAGAVSFEGPLFGWVVLRTGREARGWGAPGVAQQLVDAVPPENLAHLGLRGLPARARGDTRWGGGKAELAVSADAPHLLQIARALAALLGRPGHELTVAPKPRAEIAELSKTKRFALLLDFVRALGPSGPDTQVALLTALDPSLARRPPQQSSYEARALTSTLSLGVVGELRVAGAHMPGVENLASWQLGAVYRTPTAA